MSLQKTNFADVLDGIRVVDLSFGFAGAFCGHALAQLGASVVAVRKDGQGFSGSDLARLDLLDGGKEKVELECYAEANFDRLSALCEDADLIIEDRPHDGWPLGYPLASRLVGVRPSLTSLCISPFGLSGPHANYVAEPLTSYHSGGHARQIPYDAIWAEYENRPPVQAGGYWGESQCGLLAAIAALSVVTGNGDWRGHIVDCSKQEALIQMHWTELVRYPNNGQATDRLRPNITFVGGVLPAEDGYVQIVALEQHQWEGLVKLFGDPPWMSAPDYSSQKMRVQRWKDVAARLAVETRKRTKQDLFVEGQGMGVPIAPILSVAELRASDSLHQRGVLAAGGLAENGSPRWDGAVLVKQDE